MFGFGFVTYAEAAKQQMLGVDPALIGRWNVISGPVAAVMAFGAARVSGAELAVGITAGRPRQARCRASRWAQSTWPGPTCAPGRAGCSGWRWAATTTARSSAPGALYALDLLRRMALGLPVPDAVPITPETPPEQIDL